MYCKLLQLVEEGSASRRDFTEAFGTPCQDMGMQSRQDEAFMAFKGSLDAALALHNAVLWGWDWQIEDNIEAYVARIGPAREEFMPSIMAISFDGAARAWLIAILKALIAGEDE